MLNQCNFIGRCGKDPELKHTASGKAVATVSIACSEKYGKGEDRKEVTEWVKLVFWEKLAEIVGEYVVKGALIFVSGKMQTRSWEDKEDKKQYTTEIVVNTMKMLGGGDQKKDEGKAPAQNKQESAAPTAEEDVPF